MSKIIYKVDDELKQAVNIALEIYYRTNIEPEYLSTTSGLKIPWNKKKSILYIKGLIDDIDLLAG